MPTGAFQSFAQTGDQLGDQQRVAASPEEVLLDAQRRVVQHLPPECQQRILQFVGRCLRDAMPKVRLGLAGKAGQGLAVDLAVAGDRQAFEHAQLRREHVARHPRFDEGQQLGRLQAGAVGLAASQQDIVAKQVESAARRHHPTSQVATLCRQPLQPLPGVDEQLAALVAEVARVLHHQALADADLVVLARQFLDHQPGVGAQQLAQAGQQRRGVQRVVQGPGAEQDIHRVRRHALVEKIAVHVEAAEAYPRLVGEALAGGGEEVAGNVGEQVVHLRPSLHQRRQPGDHRAAGGGGAGAKLQQAPAPLRLALDDGGDGLGHGLVQRLGMQALAVHGLGDARRACGNISAAGLIRPASCSPRDCALSRR
ncbi:hypothetical protein BN889_04698 [Pseudomonas aeruginosa PA38182]|nr:hypothetical protein BN889_04698 [Pseudomonas aeruginosa PA38182]